MPWVPIPVGQFDCQRHCLYTRLERHGGVALSELPEQFAKVTAAGYRAKDVPGTPASDHYPRTVLYES